MPPPSKVSEVRAHVDSITAQWKRAPEVIVANSMQDDVIPEAVRQHDQTMKSRGATGEPEGFIYQGKVYLIAGQLDSLQDVSRTLFHEALGHHGLHGVFGGLLDTNLIELAALRRKEIVAKGQVYGLLPKLPENATLSEKWQAMGKENRHFARQSDGDRLQARVLIAFQRRRLQASDAQQAKRKYDDRDEHLDHRKTAGAPARIRHILHASCMWNPEWSA